MTNILTAVNKAAPAASTTPSALPSRFSEMSSEDFIKIMFTELSNQDPMQPSDSNALLQQLNSIRSIESDINLTTQLQSLVTQNQLSAASGMIGKFVGGLTADNNRVAGFVTSVTRQGSDITLELDNGWSVPITGVETVVDPSALPGGNGGGNGTGTGTGNTSGSGAANPPANASGSGNATTPSA